jgi:hypothetical protein
VEYVTLDGTPKSARQVPNEKHLLLMNHTGTTKQAIQQYRLFNDCIGIPYNHQPISCVYSSQSTPVIQLKSVIPDILLKRYLNRWSIITNSQTYLLRRNSEYSQVYQTSAFKKMIYLAAAEVYLMNFIQNKSGQSGHSD